MLAKLYRVAVFLFVYFNYPAQGKAKETADIGENDLEQRYRDITTNKKLLSPAPFGKMLEENNFLSGKRKIKSRNQRRSRLNFADPSKVDLVILTDKYSRRGSRNFDRQERYIRELVGYLPVFPARIKIAAVSISSHVKLEFDFKTFINKECTAKGIQKIRYTKGQSSLSSGLEYVFDDLIFKSTKGARLNARKVVIVFSENQLDVDQKIYWNNSSDQLGVKIVFIGVQKQTGAQSLRVRDILPLMYMENVSTLKEIGKLLGTEIPPQCQTGKVVYDRCRRRCKCVNGKLVNCCRVRTQFTEMSEEERARYIQVIKTASTHPLFKGRYEALLTVHKTIFRTGIHQATFFLPWHRWFILQYENLLREIDCGVTVPYWESAEEANDALSSDMWNTGDHGFGGNGTGSSSCVQDGPFKAEVWSVIESAGGGCLTRNFNGRFPDCITVMEALLEFSNASSFEDFEYFLHREFHDAVHCVIGGQMCTDNSASAPEFFLHHGFVDKLWSDWQRQSTEHTKNEHFTSQTVMMPATNHLPEDLLNLREQPGCVCVQYRDPGDEIYQTLLAFSKKQIEDLPRVQLPPYPERARKLFDVTEKDIQRMEKVRSFLQPVNVLREDELTGQDRILGFKKEDLAKEWARGLQRSKPKNMREINEP